MQDIDDLLEAHRIDRSVGIPVMILDYFENARSLALPRLRGDLDPSQQVRRSPLRASSRAGAGAVRNLVARAVHGRNQGRPRTDRCPQG